MKDRFKLVCASYLLIRKDNQILLHLRQNSGFMDGFYSLVSGHLDGHESFSQCMVREAKEEAGIKVKETDLTVVHVINRFEKLNPPPLSERVDVFMEVKSWQGEITNMEPDKCVSLDWFDLDDLPENTIPYIKEALMDIKNNIHYKEVGY